MGNSKNKREGGGGGRGSTSLRLCHDNIALVCYAIREPKAHLTDFHDILFFAVLRGFRAVSVLPISLRAA